MTPKDIAISTFFMVNLITTKDKENSKKKKKNISRGVDQRTNEPS